MLVRPAALPFPMLRMNEQKMPKIVVIKPHFGEKENCASMYKYLKGSKQI